MTTAGPPPPLTRLAPRPSSCRSRVEIDLDALAHNLQQFGRHVHGTARVFAVVKANAYGHGAVTCAQALLGAGAARLMVANCAEAAELRAAGIETPIHILGTLPADEMADAVELDLVPSIQDLDQARHLSTACQHQQRRLRVHVKVDTGMGRLGIRPDRVMHDLGEILPLPGLLVEGVFTHLAQADDPDRSQSQIRCFNRVCAAIDARSWPISIRHICNTTGTVLYPEAHANGVRVGLGLYGMHDPPSLQDIFPLHPVLRWTTTLHLIKTYPAGAPLGYNGTFTTQRPSRIGILPVGYADGYPRAASNRARVLVRGVQAPVVGTVSMDYTMVDLTDCPTAATGDTVTLIGTEGCQSITAETLAEWAGTIPYCITCGITSRVNRIPPARLR